KRWADWMEWKEQGKYKKVDSGWFCGKINWCCVRVFFLRNSADVDVAGWSVRWVSDPDGDRDNPFRFLQVDGI
ncbi:MAG: hypothetical protein Q4C47_03290, partial [Planctomycetia bacterium]|nr:hypothetical protein [Planctomycetia bacterium]